MKIPVTNNTAMMLVVGASLVPPGETRLFDEHEVPHHLRPAPETEAAAPAPESAGIEQILGHTVKQVVEILPSLSAAQLAALEAAETDGSGRNRKGVIEAIAQEILQRAAGQDDGDPELDAYAELVKTMDEAELQAQLDLVKDDPLMAAVINTEINRRAAPAK